MACCQLCKKLGSPDWNLFAKLAIFHGLPTRTEEPMQHTWNFGGAYANWSMTITVAAPDHLDAADLTEFPLRQFDNLARQFHDAVNLYESLRCQNDQTSLAGIYGSRVY
jgi:hypothetical protein